MENKYYTPSIEEFHIGLEIEIYHQYSESKDLFDKETYDELTPVLWNRMVTDLIKNKEVRVKYLDREDIEDLGWKFTGRAIDIWFEIEGVFDMGTWRSYKAVMHYGLHDNRLYIKMNDIGMDASEVFQGTIKNKSELKKLMKQLNIQHGE